MGGFRGDPGLRTAWSPGSQSCRREQLRVAAAARSVAGRDRRPRSLPRFDIDSCTYYFSWDSRAACAVKPQEVQMVNGTITNPVNGKSFSLGDIYFK